MSATWVALAKAELHFNVLFVFATQDPFVVYRA